METFVIAGAGMAGGRAAETLRAEGFAGRIVLIGAEPERPYERPPLSKDYLSGERNREKLYLRPAGFYAEQSIELWTDHIATSLHPDRHQIAVDGPSGEQVLFYDKLLIATGVSARRLRVPGADLPGVHYIRTMADIDGIRPLVPGKNPVVIAGAGFIGTEAAASFRKLGHDVILLEMAATPLEAALGAEVGEIVARLHLERGVDFRPGERVTAFAGDGRLESVVTANGDIVACDAVIVGVGSVPNTAWLDGSGIALDGGIVTDELNRTSVDSVFAAGDVAAWWHPDLGRRLRVEHFDHAQNHGVAAATAMLGKGEPYRPVPSFWTDQYDFKLQLAGIPAGHDRVIFRGDPASSSWTAFYLAGESLVAVLACNRFPDLAAGRRILEKRGTISPADLSNESFDLRAFSRSLR